MNEPKPPWKPATRTQDDVDQTHPGFTITCQRCSSTLVYVDNTLGYSPESWVWGSLDLVCDACGQNTEIVESG